MKFKDLTLSLDNSTTNISVTPSQEVNVLKYLPIQDKYDLIYIALQESNEGGFYSPVKLEMYFQLYTVYMYTDIEFTEEEKSDPAKLYNELASTGVIKAIIDTIPATEWEYILDTLTKTMDLKLKYKQTLASVLNGFINNLPVNAKNAMEIINKFNPADFQKVIDFATAANGGRPID
jgi:hypothetical protein